MITYRKTNCTIMHMIYSSSNHAKIKIHVLLNNYVSNTNTSTDLVEVPFRTSHMRHLKASGELRYVQTLQSHMFSSLLARFTRL